MHWPTASALAETITGSEHHGCRSRGMHAQGPTPHPPPGTPPVSPPDPARPPPITEPPSPIPIPRPEPPPEPIHDPPPRPAAIAAGQMARHRTDVSPVARFQGRCMGKVAMMPARIIGDLALIASIGYLLAVMLGAFG
jgi:hypothetical protein